MLACTISFWLPNLYAPIFPLQDINLTSMMQNIVGAFVMGLARNFSSVKYQYPQTYKIYGATTGVFCSIFTTFANVVDDTGHLFLTGEWYASPLNLFLNLSLSLISYEIGALLVMSLYLVSLYAC